MKKFLLVALTLPLFSCFLVEDFGAYWDKAGVDKRLAGSWKMRLTSPEMPVALGFGSMVRFSEKGGAYEIMAEDGETGYPLRTLNAGRYQYLLMCSKKGRVQRYKVNAHVLEFCNFPDTSLVEKFVKTHAPNAVNMKRSDSDGDFMEIALFDDQVFTILSKIPDTKAYWICDAVYDRVPEPGVR
jgi:hypothetical protein